MVRAGFGADWRCVFSNDNDPLKISSYRENWSSEHLVPGDIKSVTADQVPDNLTLAWASSPCQNFSSAGLGDGLSGASSSVFTQWWDLIASKTALGREPKIVVLENVVGLLKSRGGLDFKLICEGFVKCGYRFGVAVIDAINFLPQSRPRIFLIAVKVDIEFPGSLRSDKPISRWHPPHLVNAVEYLPEDLRCKHVWWRMPESVCRTSTLADFMLHENASLVWHTRDQTLKLLDSMTPTNLEKLIKAKKNGSLIIGTLYRRMRSIDGVNKSRAEVRFDGVAGCLRASDGGSSRQMLIYVEGDSVRTRHMTPRESARLMGLAETYKLPRLKTHAVKLVGDGVAVPVVKFLEQHLLIPLACAASIKKNESSMIGCTHGKQFNEAGCLA